jgi:predicted TIM-barrel fold metal-dependent hydrolase
MAMEETPMTTIDTHCHASASWFEPVETLLFQMDTYGVDKAVLVQHGGESDNSYLLKCAEKHSGRFAVMGFVDSTLPDAPETLAAWHARGVGSTRLFAPTGDGRGDPVSIWRAAATLGMPVSTPSNAFDVTAPTFTSLIEELSSIPIILEHYGFLGLAKDQWVDAYDQLLTLARFPTSTSRSTASASPCRVRTQPASLRSTSPTRPTTSIAHFGRSAPTTSCSPPTGPPPPRVRATPTSSPTCATTSSATARHSKHQCSPAPPSTSLTL